MGAGFARPFLLWSAARKAAAFTFFPWQLALFSVHSVLFLRVLCVKSPLSYAGNVFPRVSCPNGKNNNPTTNASAVIATGFPIV